MAADKSIHCIVLDASPLLLNEPSISSLLATAEELYTVPAVIAEVRDPTARSRMETMVLPFLKVRTPTPASVQVVSAFARKTGDSAVLSGADLQVMALAYELECERNHGDWRLRKTPTQKGVNGPPPSSLTQDAAVPPATSQAGLSNTETVKAEASETATITTAEPTDGLPVTSGEPTAAEIPAPSGSEVTALAERTQSLQLDASGVADSATTFVNDQDSELAPLEATETSSASDDEEDGWITPSNLKRHQRRDKDAGADAAKTPSKLQVATLTTDYALQNTLMLMNLNLLSSSLQRISRLKSHILRCHACFATTKQMDRQFCARCGKPTLTRVTCTTSANGEFKLHLKANMQWNHRGDRFSIPKPAAGGTGGKRGKGGRGQGGKGAWGQDLIFSDDQKEYTRAVAAQKRHQTRDLMDEDYLPNILSGARSSTSRIQIGPGRDVNARKR